MPLISLNEAITSTMRQARRTPEAEVGLIGEAYSEMVRAAETCRAYFARLPKAEIVLKSMIRDPHVFIGLTRGEWPKGLTWPPQLVVETLGQPQAGWPPALIALYRSAERHASHFSVYFERHREALNFLLEQGRQGRVRFHAQRHPHARLDHISSAELTDDLELDRGYRNLIRRQLQLSREPKGRRVPYTYYNVKVEVDDLAALLDDRVSDAGDEPLTLPPSAGSPDAGTLVGRQSDADLVDWFLKHKDELEKLPEQGQVNALRKRFDITKARRILRQLKKAYPDIRPLKGRPPRKERK
jgi:hypothetical protein